MGLDFRYTGLPRGYAVKLSSGVTTEVEAAAGNKLYITAIMTSGADSLFTLDGSDSFTFPGGSTLSLSFPLECGKFQAADTDVAVFYMEDLML